MKIKEAFPDPSLYGGDEDYWYEKHRQELEDQSRPFPSFMLEDGTVIDTTKD